MSITSVPVEKTAGTPPVPLRLRVGVILDSLTVPRWMHELLTLLEHAPVAELALIASVSENRAGSCPLPVSPRRPLLFELWRRLDHRLFQRRLMKPETFTPVSFTPRREHAEVLKCTARSIDGNVELDPRDIERVRVADLDVLLNFSEVTPNVALYHSARFGIWSFDDDKYLLDTLFWKVFDYSLVIEDGINISLSRRDTMRLPCSCSSVDNLLLSRNTSNLCSKRSTILLQCLSDLEQHGWQHLQSSLKPRPVLSRNAPGNVDTARLLLRLAFRAVRQQSRRRFFHEQWFIAFRKRSICEQSGREGSDFTILRAPSDRFYADPFVIDRGEKSYVFFEDYSFHKGKGVISYVEIDPVHGCSSPEIVLEEPYHLSYPCIFEWQGDIYLLPETKNNKTVQLYRASDFPRGWQLAHVLLEGVAAVDSTVLHHNSKFWLFTSGIGTSDPWFDGKAELFLYYSDSLSGPWTPHKQNPIVSDIRRCRPAGHVFSADGQLFRPGQDYSAADSYAVTLNLIDVLSETEYHETSVARIPPTWISDNLGTHTFNRSDRYEVLDGRTLITPLSRRSSRPVFETITPVRPLIENVAQ